jgi:hypothetical protein
MLQKHFHLQEYSIDSWPFWMFEENISIINDLQDEDNKGQRQQEDDQSKMMGSMNPSSYMKGMSSMSNKFKPPKM